MSNMLPYYMMMDGRSRSRDNRGRGRDSRRDRGDYGSMDYAREYDARNGYSEDTRYDYARGRRDYERGRQYDRSAFPFEVYGSVGEEYYPEMFRGRDFRRDGHHQETGYLSDKELMDWSKRLLGEVEEKDKAFFKYDNLQKKAKEMGIEFDKFSFDDFYTTVLMMFTDFSDTLGNGNMDLYLRLAKDFLCDEDAACRYGEKLACYYDAIVMGE